jgi:hypothetical protein
VDGTRYYNGEGTIQFTAFYPYARTPDAIVQADGRTSAEYSDFGNYAQWEEASRFNKEVAEGWINNVGQLPAPFTFTSKENTLVGEGARLEVGENFIVMKENCKDLIWDSYTGMVTGIVNGIRRPVNCVGKLVGAIPVGGISSDEASEGDLKYHYWYY